ncbi:MAG TPA: hypothetical protein VLJ88_16015 [Propionibacteriaceae bacterium]|nr:hypothetical protein [Propionibacteriaceae bacterium]
MPRNGVRAIGILLLLPAVALGLWQLVLPSWQTVRFSVYSVPGFARGPSRFLGLESYLGPWDDWTVAVTALIGVAAFALVGLVGGLLGVLTARAQGTTRVAVRAALGVMMILFAPVGVGLALRTDLRGGPDAQLLFWIMSVALLPIGSALTAVVVAAALRPGGTTAPRAVVRTVVVMFGLGLVTALALALQMLAFPAVVIGNGADTLGQAIYRYGFQFLDVARAAAISTVMLAVLAVLGVIVTVALLMLRLRVDLIPADPAAAPDRRGSWALAVALLTLVVFLVAAHEWVFGLAAPVPEDLSATDVRAVVRNTWLPPAFTTAVQVLAGVMAGFAIGALRPFGASSEALLLLFAPGLFVGLTPLLTAKYLSAAAAVRFSEVSLVPPMLLSVPAVFVFTFVFAGLRRAWVRDGSARVPVLLTGLSTVLLVTVVSWVAQAQSVTWNLVVAANSSRVAGPLLLGRLRAGDPLAPLPQQLATPVSLLILLAALAAFATVGLDQLVLRSGPLRNGLSRD